ncbi:class I SAM-dependent methyltransferase, partial [Actinosynnema sp. NPDC023794]
VSVPPVEATAHVFNSAVAAWALSAAWEVGALDELHESGKLATAEFVEANDLHGPSTAAMFRALGAVDVVERRGDTVITGPNFEEAYRARSFFHWLARGSAELFRQMPAVMRNANRTGDLDPRDAAAIAYACRGINALCYEPAFRAALARLGSGFSVVADLGCGSGERIMSIAQRHPGVRAVGVDIARPSLAVAAEEAAATGLAGRVTLVEADVTDLPDHPAFAEVDLLTCFMMGHDLWPREECVATLRRLRELFPRARTLLLGDATRTVDDPDRPPPVFTLGFEVAHDLMGVFIPTAAEWESVFHEAGWRVAHRDVIDVAVGEVVFQLEPVRG